jgi:hypothetical protein
MPIAYTVDADLGLIRTIVTGDISDAEFRTYVLRQVHNPTIQLGMKELADFRQVAQMNVTAQTLRDTVALAQTHPQWLHIPVAVVVSRDLVYGLARMYQILAEESLAPTEIFRDMDAALAWLGLPPSAG